MSKQGYTMNGGQGDGIFDDAEDSHLQSDEDEEILPERPTTNSTKKTELDEEDKEISIL
jgi:hypothetical protein